MLSMFEGTALSAEHAHKELMRRIEECYYTTSYTEWLVYEDTLSNCSVHRVNCTSTLTHEHLCSTPSPLLPPSQLIYTQGQILTIGGSLPCSQSTNGGVGWWHSQRLYLKLRQREPPRFTKGHGFLIFLKMLRCKNLGIVFVRNRRFYI